MTIAIAYPQPGASLGFYHVSMNPLFSLGVISDLVSLKYEVR
jgi:hypothetical protein